MTQLTHSQRETTVDSTQSLRGQHISSPPILLIASSNADKVHELKQYAEDAWGQLAYCTTLFDKTIFREEEKRLSALKKLSELVMKTPGELALEKARTMAKAFSCFALAEETLLFTPILGNEDEAFYEKLHLTHVMAENSFPSSSHLKKIPDSKRILNLLKNYHDSIARSACIVSYVAYASPDGEYGHTISTRLEGYIADEEKGSRSYEFGSIFMKHEYSKTLSELSQSVYRRISHRLKAIQKLTPLMREALLKYTQLEAANRKRYLFDTTNT